MPVWLAAGFAEQLDTVVLRPLEKHSAGENRSRFVPRWFSWWMDVVSSGIDSRDGVSLDATARLEFYDIPTTVGPFDFHLRPDQVEELVGSGRYAVAHYEERVQERIDRALEARAEGGFGERDSLAIADAMRRYEKNERSQAPTVFISYAREDRKWVERIKEKLRHLVASESVTLWDDSYIASGDDFTAAIVSAVSRARVMVLVGSRRAWDSTYITKTELPLLFGAQEQG